MNRMTIPALLVACVSCGGQVATEPFQGTLPDGEAWGGACKNPDALSTPPACTLDPDGGADPVCQQWADSIVTGATGGCGGGTSGTGHCMLGIHPPFCTPGPEGDVQCQIWLQQFSRTAVYAKCWPQGPNDPAVIGNQCVAANACTIDSRGQSSCTCGSKDPCTVSKGSLCVDVGGSPACAPWCQ